MNPLPDLSNPAVFAIANMAIFAIIIGRYLLVAGLFHWWFYVKNKEQWRAKRLGKKQVNRSQYRKEIKWSMITSMIFALAGAATVLLWQKGYTKVYTSVSDYGWWYLPVSLVLSMLIHETYYYWIHRWMHLPKVFRVMHKVHHDSHTTSAWTAFSFHPLEGLLQALILPATILVLPMHIYVLLLQLTLMTFSSVINHLEIEVYPQQLRDHFLGRWIIGATHHSLHHKQFRYNYGLYFTFWDKLKNTECPALHTTANIKKPAEPAFK